MTAPIATERTPAASSTRPAHAATTTFVTDGGGVVVNLKADRFVGRDAGDFLLVPSCYGVLLFDRRGEGQSEGDFNVFGWCGNADIKAAFTFLVQRPDVDAGRIGGLGSSVGGEMLLETAAEDERLRAVVSEGAGVHSLAEHWSDRGPALGRSRSRTGSCRRWPWTALANQAPPPGLGGLVDDIAPRPLLLIRGLDGQQQEVLNRVY